MGGGWKDFEEHNKGNLSCLEQTDSRNLDLGDTAWEGSKGSEKHAIENWKNSCYVLAEKLICTYMGSRKSTYELGNVAEDISRKSVEGDSFFLLLIQEGKCRRTEWLVRKETEMDGFGKSPPLRRTKN